MTVDTPTATYSTTEAVRAAGCTYRQLDHWLRCGYLGAPDTPGSGRYRTLTHRQVRKAQLMHDILTVLTLPGNAPVKQVVDYLDANTAWEPHLYRLFSRPGWDYTYHQQTDLATLTVTVKIRV